MDIWIVTYPVKSLFRLPYSHSFLSELSECHGVVNARRSWMRRGGQGGHHNASSSTSESSISSISIPHRPKICLTGETDI